VFTGDRSGDFLYAALHRAGLANQPTAVSRDDGLRLHGVYITAAARCAPPANKPTPKQLDNCRPYLIEESQTLEPRAIVCLGSIAWNAVVASLAARGFALPRPRPKFTHAAEVSIGNTTILGCYHVSQQNTFTGRLTEAMLDDVINRAKRAAGLA
jgi:uracil-DNA glycosylase family 4